MKFTFFNPSNSLHNFVIDEQQILKNNMDVFIPSVNIKKCKIVHIQNLEVIDPNDYYYEFINNKILFFSWTRYINHINQIIKKLII